MTTPRKKKQFTVSNYGSFTEEIKWSWAPVSKTETEDGHVILRFDSTEVTRDVYMKTVETLMGLFPELPSILEFTNCDAEGVRMSKLAYSLLKITSYAQYLTPANLQAVSPPRLTNVPQFPHIIRLFLIDQPEERPFAMDCFVRVLRTWMAFGADDLYYVSAIDYEKASYSDRNKIFSKIPDILDMFLMVFREDVCEFLSFVGMNAVGASILYNFLFLTEIDMFHRFFLSEIRAYLSYCESDEADNNKSAITARHLSFLILVESLESASHDTNGYAYMTSGDNKECCVKLMALKVQFFAFICDPLMDPNVAVMLMCLLTSSKMHPDRNAAMLRFAADMKLRVSPPITLEASSSTDAAPPIKIAVPLSRIYNEGQLSLRRVRANFFARDSVTGSPIEYLDSIKTTPKKARTPRKPNLHTLHLFISSLEACLYPSATMKLEALPLASMYAKTNKVFPFVARVKGVKNHAFVGIRNGDAQLVRLDPHTHFQHPPAAGTYLPWLTNLFNGPCDDELMASYDPITELYSVPGWGSKVDDFGDAGGITVTCDIIDLAYLVSSLHSEGVWQNTELEETSTTTTTTSTSTASTSATNGNSGKGKGKGKGKGNGLGALAVAAASSGDSSGDDDDDDNKGKGKSRDLVHEFNCDEFSKRVINTVATALVGRGLGTHGHMQTNGMGVILTVYCKTTATAAVAARCAATNNLNCDANQISGYHPCDTKTFLGLLQLNGGRSSTFGLV